MTFRVLVSREAEQAIAEPAKVDAARADKVRRTIAKMQVNLRSKGLSTHEYTSKAGPNNENLFEACVENDTPNAHRVLWYYGPEPGFITVVTIIPHPKDKCDNSPCLKAGASTLPSQRCSVVPEL